MIRYLLPNILCREKQLLVTLTAYHLSSCDGPHSEQSVTCNFTDPHDRVLKISRQLSGLPVDALSEACVAA